MEEKTPNDPSPSQTLREKFSFQRTCPHKDLSPLGKAGCCASNCFGNCLFHFRHLLNISACQDILKTTIHQFCKVPTLCSI